MSDYAGSSLREQELSSNVGLEYYVNREIVLFSRYQHTAFESTDQARNYNADIVRIGMRYRQ